MFANKSAAYPEGFLDRNTLKSFYAMTGTDDSNMVYTPGFERIPNNWYTRAIGDPYDVPLVDQDLTMLFAQNQQLDAFGGNTGTVNSFTGLNVANLTVSTFNSSHPMKDKQSLLSQSGICIRPKADYMIIGRAI